MSVCVFVYACNKECCTAGMVNKKCNHAGPKQCSIFLKTASTLVILGQIHSC